MLMSQVRVPASWRELRVRALANQTASKDGASRHRLLKGGEPTVMPAMKAA